MLPIKQEKFVYEFVATGNGTKSAIAAGFSEKTAYSQASRMLKNVKVKDRIAELKANIAEAAGINAIMVARELKKIAFANPSDVYKDWMTLQQFDTLSDDVKAAIAEITSEERVFEGNRTTWVKIKWHNKLQALEAINKMLGFNKEKEEAGASNLFNGPVQIINNVIGEMPVVE